MEDGESEGWLLVAVGWERWNWEEFHDLGPPLMTESEILRMHDSVRTRS